MRPEGRLYPWEGWIKLGLAVGLLAGGVPLQGCASGGRTDNEAQLLEAESPGEAPLLPGDEIRLTFSREPDLNGDYSIDQGGYAALPLLGSRQVADRPAAIVAQSLAAEYAERTRNQQVQVIPLRRVRVLGEVRSPGLYYVDPTMTFDDAIALAGGATNDGNLENVRLIRHGEEIVDGLDVSRSVAASIESGDQLFVPKTSWFSRNGAILIGATISAIGVILAFSR